jgi:hypothetical protein
MIWAIHKNTGKIVEARKIENDLTWKGTEKDSWIAPHGEIQNWNELKEKGITEVPVSFIKSHQVSTSNELRRAHFRKQIDEAITCSENESEEHKLAKEGIYYALLEKKKLLDIGNNKRNLEEFGSCSISIEERISAGRTSKIADVLVKFEKEHPLLGLGIVFEVQFSKQGKNILELRNYQRVLEGYSTCWLFEEDFNLEYNLKEDSFIITPFKKAIEDYEDYKKEKQDSQLREISEKIDSKIQELNYTINKIELSKRQATSDIDFYLSKTLTKFKEESQEEIEKLEKEKRNLLKESFKININEIKEIIKNDILKNLSLSNIDFQKFLTEKINENLQKVLINQSKSIENQFRDELHLFQIKLKSDLDSQRNDLLKESQDISKGHLKQLSEFSNNLKKDIEEKTSEKIKKEILEEDIKNIISNLVNKNFWEYAKRYLHSKFDDIIEQNFKKISEITQNSEKKMEREVLWFKTELGKVLQKKIKEVEKDEENPNK